MDEDGEKRVQAKRYDEKVDRFSNLPDSLKFEILLNLRTNDVVKTSVLSSGWRNVWRYVPGLDLNHLDFSEDDEHDSFVSFVDSFLGFNNESRLLKFMLFLNDLNKYEDTHLTKWINTIVERKVEQFNLSVGTWYEEELKMPQILYTCESLVSLKLSALVELASPKFVSLPSLKAMDLVIVRFTGDLALETLILGCPVLERLYILRSSYDKLQVLRVCSQSLLSFTYTANCLERLVKDLVVVIDTPRLEYLKLIAHRNESFELNNLASLVKADIDIIFNLSFGKNIDPNDIPKRNVIRNFLRRISSVKDMIISLNTLEVIYRYSRCETLPLLRNLSSLQVELDDYRWEMLPIFLESCPNLKSLVVGSTRRPKKDGISIVSGPRCLLKSLDYVEIKRPLKGEAMEMKLVSYLLENSPILKKLTLWLDGSIKKEESVILNELHAIPRLSTSCQLVIHQ